MRRTQAGGPASREAADLRPSLDEWLDCGTLLPFAADARSPLRLRTLPKNGRTPAVRRARKTDDEKLGKRSFNSTKNRRLSPLQSFGQSFSEAGLRRVLY